MIGRKCPVCEGTQIAIERRINGNCRCQSCGHEWPNRRIDIEAALAERDKRITELEAAITEVVNISRREINDKDDYQKNYHDLNSMIYKVGMLVGDGR